MIVNGVSLEKLQVTALRGIKMPAGSGQLGLFEEASIDSPPWLKWSQALKRLNYEDARALGCISVRDQ